MARPTTQLPTVQRGSAVCCLLTQEIDLKLPITPLAVALMLQNVISFLIERLGDQAGPIAVFCAAAGVFVWLLGARFSKSIAALVGVGAGACVGMHLPEWYGWHFDGKALG